MRTARTLALACLATLAAPALLAPTARAAFDFAPGVAGLSVLASGEGGVPTTVSGSHPAVLSTAIEFAAGPESPGEPGVPFSDGDLKDLEIEWPAGLVENPAAVPHCTLAQFHTPRSSPFEASLSGESCPERTQVGTVAVRSSFGGGSERTFGLFNLEAPLGAPSAIGFNAYGAAVVLVPHVRDAQAEYGLSLAASDISQVVNLRGLTLNVWGDPWAATHNSQRGDCLNEAEPSFGWAKCSVGRPKATHPTAYLTLPTTCTEPPIVTVDATSWQEPSRRVSRSAALPTLSGCGSLAFAPVAQGRAANPRASSSSGFEFDLTADQTGLLSPKFRAASPVKTAVVTLPEGMTINPSVGAGLGVCGQGAYEAIALGSAAGCPEDSKIGDFSVKTPLFEETLEGALYLAAPHDNPFGTLLGIYMVASAPARGTLVKLAGKLDADPASGRLTATFENLPQLPYTDLKVHFREGQRSPLATPGACGSYSTSLALTPWRSPGTVVENTTPFAITSGVGGGPCPTGATPFRPGALAGTLNSNAGSFSPFYLHLTRADSEQEITSYSVTLPPGLTGKLAGIPYCPDAAIEAAKHASGFAEAAHPSCPASSEIGHTVSGFGLNPVLSYAPGGLYLAGPFHGSPFSIVAIDSATVGPFDLGVIVVRSAIKVDPQTAQVSIDSAGSDPIPHIIDGIPIHLSDVRVYIDRPGFTRNPTSCERFSVASVLNGSGQRFSDPSDDSTVTVDSPFQAFDCVSLGFAPKLALRLRGGTKRANFPSLHATVTPRPGDADIASATVALPASEFLEQAHIKTLCTRPQFAREACPSDSVYGRARAISPLLGAPLEGKVYLRVSDRTLPDLVAALRGGGNDLAIDVVGHIDAVRGGLRASFENLPDAPVTKFAMTLFGGKRGLLVNADNLCAAPQHASASFVGQNNLGRRWAPKLAVSCKKKRKHRGGDR